MNIFFHVLALALLLAPSVVFGQEGRAFAPLTSIPGIADAGNAPNISDFLNQLYKICIGAAAVIAVLQIVRAGILFMTNKGSVSENEQARSLLQGAVFGLILVLSPVVVFNIINPKILELDFSAEKLETSTIVTEGEGDTETGPDSPTCRDTSTYDRYQYATVPEGRSCNDVIAGGGWANAWPAQAMCCEGERGEGQTCCAHSAIETPPVTPPSAREFNIATQKLELDLDTDADGDKCRLTSYQAFETQALCDAQEANVLAGRYSGTVLTKRCDGSSVTPPLPATTWATMSSSRVCPS